MRRRARLILDTILLGVIGAMGAQVFSFLLGLSQDLLLRGIGGYHPPALPTEGGPLVQTIGPHGLWPVVIAIVLGGLISGFLVYTFAPEAEGHGTDTAVHAFHRQGGKIRRRVAPLKILASAITIGSGGAAGREGPTALFSAGFGSIYAGLTHRTEADRRLLVLIGMAAGLSAIFRSPIGTAIFAVEVLYSDMEFESEALVYTMLGSVIAYAVNALFVGGKPLFEVPATLEVTRFVDYAWYILLGLASGAAGAFIPGVFYRTRDLFHRIKVAPQLKPALGGLGVGVLALFLPQVLGGGYGWMQLAMNGRLALSLMAALMVGKLLAFALTVSSGGSGGVFAPTLFVGAMLGGTLGHVLHQPPAAFVIIGMAAVFGSAARVPIATLLMVTEMTGGYHLLVPAALAVMLAFMVQRVLSLSLRLKYPSLYEAQVPRPSNSPAHRSAHLERAIWLLGPKLTQDPEVLGRLDFTALLENESSVEIAAGRDLFLGTVSPRSPCVGLATNDPAIAGRADDWEIVAVFRDREMLAPLAEIRLEADDQVLIVTRPDVVPVIRQRLEPARPDRTGPGRPGAPGAAMTARAGRGDQ